MEDTLMGRFVKYAFVIVQLSLIIENERLFYCYKNLNRALYFILARRRVVQLLSIVFLP